MSTKSQAIGQTSLFGSHQVDNKRFLEALKVEKNRYKEAIKQGKRPPTLADYPARCIGAICEGLALRPNYRNYTYRDDMVSTAIINCVKYWHNFDPDRFDNPHAYFTFIASKSFNRYIKSEKKAHYVRYMAVEQMVMDMSLTHEETGYKEFLETFLKDQAKVRTSFEESNEKPKKKSAGKK